MREELNRWTASVTRRLGLRDVPAGLVAVTVCLSVVAGAWAMWRWWPRAGASSAGSVQVTSGETASKEGVHTTPPRTRSIYVHVVGAVRHAGMYELPAGSRVAKAIEAAGGLLPDAVVEEVNLARVVEDGEQIAVPDEDEVAAAAGEGRSGTGSSVVDLNTADAAALDALPGVGPSTAQKIIADREANGPFASVEDLGRVAGIGPKRLEQLRDLVRVK